MTLVTELHYEDSPAKLVGPFDSADDAVRFGERVKRHEPKLLDYYVRPVDTPLYELLRLNVPNEPMRGETK